MSQTLSSGVLEKIAEEVWNQRLEREPFLQLRMGVPVQGLPHGSLQEAEEDAAFAGRALKALKEVNADELAGEEPTTLAFLRESLKDLADAPSMWWWGFPVTPYNTYPLSVIALKVLAEFRFENRVDVDRYLNVIGDYGAALRCAAEKLRAQSDRGWSIPQAAASGVVAAITGLQTNAQKLMPVGEERVSGLSSAECARLSNGITSLLNDDITPTAERLLATFEETRSTEVQQTGLSNHPGGDDAYERLVRHHATFDISPQEIHDIGLHEVELITDTMRDVRAATNFAGTESEFRSFLEAEGHVYATDAEEVERRYREAIRRIEPHIGTYFAITPKTPYDVERLDPALEAGMSYGYYEQPTAGLPIGRYRYNGSGLTTRSQLSAAAIIYHELIPGHHFHIARQQENESLPTVRKELGYFTAFSEGWAEYAAGLADEMGMYEGHYDRYGWLVHQRFIAQRLVVDTGMNALGWSIDRAREFMSENTLESEDQVATETLRYSTDLPGQALAYRLGFLKLRALGSKMKEALGHAFDLRDFHEVVLAPGGLPLSVVEGNVDRRIAKHQPSPN